MASKKNSLIFYDIPKIMLKKISNKQNQGYKKYTTVIYYPLHLKMLK